MWEVYIKVIDEFINENDDVSASPVIDHFHVAQTYRDDFDDLRKKELRRLKKELPPETYVQDCKGMLWSLRKNHAALNSDECQTLRRLFAHSLALYQAYTFREELTVIFNYKLSVAEAEHRLETWIAKVQRTSIDTFDGFIKTLRNHRQYIVNYFDE